MAILPVRSSRVSSADAERWWTNLREAHEAGIFFYAVYSAERRRHEDLRTMSFRKNPESAPP